MAKLYIHTWAHVHAHTDDSLSTARLPVSASELAIKNKDKYLIL